MPLTHKTLKESLMPPGAVPAVITLATHNYFKTVSMWIKHVRRAGCHYYRIICLDDEIQILLHQQGEKNTISHYEILPDAPRICFRPDMTHEEIYSETKKVFKLKLLLFAFLTEQGIDFIYSDSDAFWLKDPRPWLMSHPEYDLLISQGMQLYGPASYDQTKFPIRLCSGFFLARSNRRTQNYFNAAISILKTEGILKDQYCMNKVLIQNSETSWNIQKPMYFPCMKKSEKSVFWAILIKILSTPILHRYSKTFVQWFPHHYFVTSPEIMCLVNNKVKVGVIPMHLVVRKNAVFPWHWEHLVDKTEILILHSDRHKPDHICRV